MGEELDGSFPTHFYVTEQTASHFIIDSIVPPATKIGIIFRNFAYFETKTEYKRRPNTEEDD